MKKCLKCNQLFMFDDDLAHCPNCGSKLKDIDEVDCFCSKCGEKLGAEAKFCPICGTPANNQIKQEQVLSRKPDMVNQSVQTNEYRRNVPNVTAKSSNKYFSFTGRLNRKPYIIRNIILNIIISLFGLMLYDSMEQLFERGSERDLEMFIVGAALCFAVSIVISISWFSLAIRRCHDLNKSGWFILLAFIPFVNIGIFIYLIFAKGTIGRNLFGEDPLENKF